MLKQSHSLEDWFEFLCGFWEVSDEVPCNVKCARAASLLARAGFNQIANNV